MIGRRRYVSILLAVLPAWAAAFPARGDIYKHYGYDLLAGGEGIKLGPGIDLSNWNTPGHDLQDAYLHADLTGASFANSNLNFANLGGYYGTGARLLNADFSNASIRGADFTWTVPGGFTPGQLYSTASYKARDLRRVTLASNNLTGWDFSDQDLTGAIFDGANVAGAIFQRANISGTRWTAVTGLTPQQIYSTSSFATAKLTGIEFHLFAAKAINFSGQNLSSTSFLFSDFSGASFDSALLQDTRFFNTNITGATFAGARLERVTLDGTTGFIPAQLYTTASYAEFNLKGFTLTNLSLAGGNFAFQDFSGTTGDRVNMNGANLAYARMNNVVFKASTFIGARFTDATLLDANLLGCDLTAAEFAGARINGATLNLSAGQLYSTASYRERDLSRVSFKGNLSGANFRDQDLTGASFADTAVPGADFTGATLRNATLSKTFTAAQLYATSSYLQRDLTGVGFGGMNLSGWNLAGQNLSYARFQSADVSGTNFTDAIIRGANFHNATFTAAKLASTASYQQRDLPGIKFNGLNFTGMDFAGHDLTHASIVSSTLIGADFRNATLAHASLDQTDLSQAAFQNAHLAHTSLVQVNFTGADLTGADFSNASMDTVNLAGATLTGVLLKGSQLYFPKGFTAAQLYATGSYATRDFSGIIWSGISATGWDFAALNLSQCDLHGTFSNATFAGSSLRGGTFNSSPFVGTNFRGADLSGASFWGSELERADFSNALLHGTDFYFLHTPFYDHLEAVPDFVPASPANLRGASFAAADLSHAHLRGADLSNTNFLAAIVRGTSFRQAVGFHAAQLYATASYNQRDLSGIDLARLDLSGWNFARQNLAGASFARATLSGADFDQADLSNADLRGASGFTPVPTTITRNTIFPDGSLHTLVLGPAEVFTLHNDRLPIGNTSLVAFDRDSTLRLLLEPSWSSALSMPAATLLHGTLDLQLAPGIHLQNIVGDSFELFHWQTPLDLANRFDTILTDPRFIWDLSALYTTGTVSITGPAPIPEPATLLLLLSGSVFLSARRPIRRMR